MLIVALKPGHDGSVAVLEDRQLKFCFESEKDSYHRHKALNPETFLASAEFLPDIPDVFALGGWQGAGCVWHRHIGCGYYGVDQTSSRTVRMFGREVTQFTSTHERSHLMTALGMAPKEDVPAEAVLVWEGMIGAFTHVDHRAKTLRNISVLPYPGMRYALIYAVADPTVPSKSAGKGEFAGKVMALAAYGDPKAADDEIRRTVDLLMDPNLTIAKRSLRGTPLYHAGVESDVCKITAALFTQRMFDLFAGVAERELPPGLPLRISGGCGLNCDWNSLWRARDHFTSVFVPPCSNDSGSAIGTAIDALASVTGDPYIEWDVYTGREFEVDTEPDPEVWACVPRRPDELAAALSEGRVVAWAEGRWEIGPRALCHRSLLAEPFNAATKDRLNEIKKRESFRPIAPVCRLEDARFAFHEDFPDPYMLYFRRVRSPDLRAVTHVDGSARAQTVTAASNPAIYELLTAFAQRHGIGVLCNTSLNFSGYGFINRMSDLVLFCDDRGIDDFVVEGKWYQRRHPATTPSATEQRSRDSESADELTARLFRAL
jgi:hydroxymethyl cephem carbamoyltransferase